MKRRFALTALLLSLAIAGCGKQGGDVTALVNALFCACTNAMVSNTCRVMQDKGQTLVPQGATVIFVSGIGPIDADLYKKLRGSGEGMCAQVREVCAGSWNSQQCKTARTLYGAQ
jgi:hypothetical protein